MNLWIYLTGKAHLVQQSIHDDDYNFVIVTLNCPPEL